MSGCILVRKTKLLITGFNKFGGLDYNLSELVLGELSTNVFIRKACEANFEILATEYDAASGKIRELISLLNPAAIVMLGVSGNATGMVLERVALNYDDAAILDNAEISRRGKIVKDGPVGYWSTLPLHAIEQRLREKGIPVEFSNHAGSFLCNHVFYVAMHELAKRNSQCQCGFIHIPTGQRAPADMRIAEAVEECVKAIIALH